MLFAVVCFRVRCVAFVWCVLLAFAFWVFVRACSLAFVPLGVCFVCSFSLLLLILLAFQIYSISCYEHSTEDAT